MCISSPSFLFTWRLCPRTTSTSTVETQTGKILHRKSVISVISGNSLQICISGIYVQDPTEALSHSPAHCDLILRTSIKSPLFSQHGHQCGVSTPATHGTGHGRSRFKQGILVPSSNLGTSQAAERRAALQVHLQLPSEFKARAHLETLRMKQCIAGLCPEYKQLE